MARLSFLRVVLGGLLLLCVANCSWTQVPESDEAIVSPRQLDDGPDRDPGAELYPVEAGYWVYVRAEDREPTLGAEVGDLLTYDAPSDARRSTSSVFTAIAERSWGYLLQRLTVGAVREMPSSGDLQVLDDEATRLPTPSGPICRGRGKFEGDDCLERTERGRRWAVYRLDDSGRLQPRPLSESGLAVPRARMLHRSLFDGTWHSFAGDGAPLPRWLALPIPGRFASLPGGRILADSSCEVDASRLRQMGLEVERGSLDGPTHPVVVEARAYESTADTLVTCRGGARSWAVPALFRAELTTLQGRSLGPNLFGLSPLAPPKLPPRQRARLLRATTAAARGDAVVADAYLEQLFRDVGYQRLEGIVLRAAQIASAAGRPEAALNWSQLGSKARWDRTADPLYATNRAVAYRAFGRHNKFASQLLDIERLAPDDLQGPNARRRAWFEWMVFRLAPRDARSSRKLEKMAETYRDRGLPLWGVALELERLRRGELSGEQPLEALSSRAQSEGVMSLVEALQYRDVERNCSDASCSVDVYGRRLTSVLDTDSKASHSSRLGPALARAGDALVRPGFEADLHLSDAPSFSTRVLVTPLLEGLDAETRRSIGRLTASHLRDGRACEETIPDWWPTFFEVIRRSAPFADPDESGVGAFFQWWYDRGLSDSCQRPARAARQMRRQVERTPAIAPIADPLFLTLFDRADTPGARRTILEGAARLAAAHDRGEACKTRHLALAAAYADAHRLDEAESHLGEAVNCPTAPSTSDLGRLEPMIAAYVSFERSGSFPRDLDNDIGERLERALHMRPQDDQTCVGLVDATAYDMLDYLPGDVGRLARHLDLETVRSERGELSLTTSSVAISDAHEALRTLRERLRQPPSDRRSDRANDDTDKANDTPDVHPLVEPLYRAHRLFDRYHHQPGIARTRFLSFQLFDRPPDTLPDWTPPEPAPCTDRSPATEGLASPPTSPEELRCVMRSGQSPELVDRYASEGETLSSEARRAAIAATLILEPRERWANYLPDRLDRSDVEPLCTPPTIDSPLEQVTPAQPIELETMDKSEGPSDTSSDPSTRSDGSNDGAPD